MRAGEPDREPGAARLLRAPHRSGVEGPSSPLWGSARRFRGLGTAPSGDPRSDAVEAQTGTCLEGALSASVKRKFSKNSVLTLIQTQPDW